MHVKEKESLSVNPKGREGEELGNETAKEQLRQVMKTVLLYVSPVMTYVLVQECGKKKKNNEKKQPNSDDQISPLKFHIC